MSQRISPLVSFIFFLASFIFLLSCQSETTKIETDEGVIEMSSDEYLKTIGEIYLYGYPLVLMDLTKKRSTCIDRPHPNRALAPVNQLSHFRSFPDHTLTAVVKPNVDTYYSIAWLDLKTQPVVLSMPATDRYYLLPFLDAYSNVFASPGTRTTGTDALDLLVVGPDWQGEVPEGMTLIEAPTEMVWMLGRIQVNSPKDGATKVREIQDQMSLVPLSAYGDTSYVAPLVDVTAADQNIIPVKDIEALSLVEYMNRVSQLMVANGPASADSTIVAKMKKVGFVPGEGFEISTDNLILSTKMKAIPNFVHKSFNERRASPDTSLLTNGWGLINEKIGTYGIEYKRRAYIDFIGLGACIPADAVYPNCVRDMNGDPLDASETYQIHFDKEQLPPVKAFWSLTAYNEDEFLVENEWSRFARGDRDSLIYNEDGSLDLYIQTEPIKGDMMNNWLPIPADGPFFLTLRLYWPKAEVLNGEWDIPPVIPIKKVQ